MKQIPLWNKERSQLGLSVPERAWDWLSRPYKLSVAFKRVSSTLRVDVISQRFEPILMDEAAYLGLVHGEQPFLRQVYILGDAQRFEYARVIIPKRTYELHFKQLESLGQNLIGERMLYSRPDMRRSAFEYAALRPNDLRYEKALENFDGECPDVLWTRRSIFWLSDAPLSVMEVFLPGIPPFKPEN